MGRSATAKKAANKGKGRQLEPEAGKTSRIVSERLGKSHAKKFLLNLSNNEISGNRKLIEDIKIVIRDDKVALDGSKLALVRDNLPLALSFARCTKVWNDDTDNVPGFFLDLLRFLAANFLAMNLSLSKECTLHLVACWSLCEIRDYDFESPGNMMTTIVENCAGRDAIEPLVSDLIVAKPGRKVYCSLLIAVMKNSWVTASDVTLVCEAAALVLRDPRSHPEINSLCYDLAYSLGNQTQWVDIVCAAMLESMREASLRAQIGGDSGNDFQDMLFIFSQTKALVKAGVVTPLAEAISAPKGNRQYNEEDWEFFLEEWLRDDTCIASCECKPKQPALYCYHSFFRNMRSKIETRISSAEEYSSQGLHEKVVYVIYGVQEDLKSYRDRCECSNPSETETYTEKIRTRALLLQAESLTALECHSDALSAYMCICENVYPAPKTNQQSLLCGKCGPHVDNKYEAEALYKAAASLAALSRKKEALEALDFLLKATDASSPVHDEEKRDAGRGPEQITTGHEVEDWREKARELKKYLKRPGSIAKTPPIIVAPASMSSSTASVEVPIGRCKYKEYSAIKRPKAAVAKQESNCYHEDCGDFTEPMIVPRLQWVILWFHGDIVIWDYGKEEVVHWLLFDDNDLPKELTAAKLVDLPEHDSLLYFHSDGGEGFYLTDLQRLSPRGGKTSVLPGTSIGAELLCTLTQGGSVKPSLSDSDVQTWLKGSSGSFFNCRCLAVSKNGAGQWRLAISRHNDGCAVDVYREDQIRSGTALGPFFIKANSRPSFELLGHKKCVQIVEFIGPDSPFIATAAKSVIRIWDALGSASAGACVLTIYTSYARIVSSLCFSKGLMFGASQVSCPCCDDKDEKICQSISVWALPRDGFQVQAGTVASTSKPPLLATLVPRFQPGTTLSKWVTAMTIVEEQSLLVAAHSDGVVNLWRYDDSRVDEAVVSDPSIQGKAASPVVSHLRSLMFWAASGARLSTTITTVPGSLLYVGDTKHLFCLDLLNVLVDNEDDDGVLTNKESKEEYDTAVEKFSNIRRSIGVCASMMNCGHCGRYLMEKSCLCSACTRVRFCDRACQLSGWPAHKALCRASKAGVSVVGEQEEGVCQYVQKALTVS